MQIKPTIVAYKAIIAGASGLIGSNLLNILLQSHEYHEVLVLTRNELQLQHKKLVQLVIDFDHLEDHVSSITGDAVFCCLGTTNAQTPDKEVYRKIDYGYPLTIARLANKNGVKQFHLVSSIGADKNSMAFYTRLKGELEDALQKIGIPVLHIYQPSMLVGERERKRPMEKVMIALFKFINPLLIGSLKKYRSITGKRVAQAMYTKSLDNSAGTFIHTSDKIQSI